jgi:hypothetical protein
MEPDLGSRELLAVVAAGDRDQPKLLAAALANRFGHDVDRALGRAAQEVRLVAHADGELAPPRTAKLVPMLAALPAAAE